MLIDKPLTREDIKSVIEGRGAARRVPAVLHFWVGAGAFGDRQAEVQEILERYPMDIQIMSAKMPDIFNGREDDPEYRWVNFDDPCKNDNIGIDSRSAISDWSLLDGILQDFPDKNYPNMTNPGPPDDGRYRLGLWWFCFFERHWSLRGMENALMDYYTDPESVHRLFRALTDFYLAVIERMAADMNVDGVFTSDDIGTQTGPFFSLGIFREFYKPYYKELIDKAHSLGLHFWLHTCGNVELFMPDFVEIGLDVIHPIQKYTMDEQNIAKQFGKDICIWAGFDVQQIIPWGTPEDVRREVRFMIDTYQRPEGKLMLTAGNGVTGDTPVESLRALFDETITYGKHVCK